MARLIAAPVPSHRVLSGPLIIRWESSSSSGDEYPQPKHERPRVEPTSLPMYGGSVRLTVGYSTRTSTRLVRFELSPAYVSWDRQLVLGIGI